MNLDRFVMSELVDSITMNLGKGDSGLLSKEETNSERFHLNFLSEKVICIICFSMVLCSIMCFECTKEETYLPWLREGNITSILVLRVRF